MTKRDISMVESLLFLQAIGQCSGKRKASETLSTSIDTINKYIENLEEDLGVKLVSTNGKGSNLTCVAQRIVDKAAKIKEILDEVTNIKFENREIKGEVRICISLGYASYVVPKELYTVFDVFPELKICSVTLSDISKVDMKDIDIALTYEEINSYDVTEIASKKVYCGFFASPKYLSEHGYPVDLEDLLKNHRLLNSRDNMLKKAIGEENFKRAHICFQTNNTLAKINAVENSAGIGIMPLSFALQGLVCLDNIAVHNPVCYHLYANKYTKDIPRVRTLINFYKSIVDKIASPVPLSDNETCRTISAFNKGN